nr:hypothetical protein PFGPPNCM_00228 [Paraburkholderia sp.]
MPALQRVASLPNFSHAKRLSTDWCPPGHHHESTSRIMRQQILIKDELMAKHQIGYERSYQHSTRAIENGFRSQGIQP